MLQLVDIPGRMRWRRAQPVPPRVLGLRRRLAIAFEERHRRRSQAPSVLDAAAAELRELHRDRIEGLLAPFRAMPLPFDDLGLLLSDQAERCIDSALHAALRHVAQRDGPAPGDCAVLELGKLGGQEMTVASDLDIIFLYDPADTACPNQAAGYFDQVAKAMIRLLTWSEGHAHLYEVDMRLRPHGDDGPLAVSLAAFARYYEQECWSWELLALARGRCVVGRGRLCGAVTELLSAIHAQAGRRPELTREVADMRALLQDELPAQSVWDLKRSVGGLTDLEFLAQTQLLLAAGSDPEFRVVTGLRRSLRTLSALGRLPPRDLQVLCDAAGLYHSVQHVQKLAGVLDLEHAADPHKQLASLTMGCSPAVLRRRLGALQSQVRRRFEHYVGPVAADAAHSAA